MRTIILMVLCAVFLCACKKDKYTSAPQIKYKSINTNFIDNNIGSLSPVITFSITDAEGDLGITAEDTARIYIKNLLNQSTDSIDFPDLKDVSKADFKADILASVRGAVFGCTTTNPPGRVDTMYYEIYVKDFAKNQSNTIVTAEPLFQQCP